MELLDSLARIEDTVLRSKIAKALAVLKRTLALYPLEAIALSFNGGKDCTVLMDLVMRACPLSYQEVLFVYFKHRQEFPEVG